MRSKKAIKNIISSLSLQFVTLICGLIVPKMIISTYGSNINGLISSITQFLSYIMLLESGIGPVIKSLLYKPLAKKNQDDIKKILKSTEKFFRNIASIFLIYIFIIMFGFSYAFKEDYNIIFTSSLVIIISISIFAEYFFGMTYRLFLQSNQEAYVVSNIQIITTIINTIVVVVTIKIGFNVQIVKLLSALIFVIRPLAQNLYVKSKYNIVLKNVTSNYKLEKKWDGLAQHIAAVIHNNTDIAILTIFCNLTEVSVYSVYYLVLKGIKSIVQSVSNSLDSIFGDMLAKKEFKNLNKKFATYEIIYCLFITIIFSTTMILIVPFVKIYTKNITDVNYVRYLFGYLLVISEFIWAIRLPYSSITLAAGHFKETKTGAWIEAGLNISISILLVNKYGIVGVAIGTLIAMLIRTIEFINHTNKYILNRSNRMVIKNLTTLLFETIIIVFVYNKFNSMSYDSYIMWFGNSIIIVIINSVISFLISYILNKTEFKYIFELFYNKLKNKNNYF